MCTLVDEMYDGDMSIEKRRLRAARARLFLNGQDRSTALTEEGLRPVLIIDEAHDLRPDTLGMLKVLANFDLDSRLVLSIGSCSWHT